uniref:Uncharacterized protein n=1 Tax=Glossina pallidipes TaxID=7398 RepID=A0A1A9ZXU4_GLOPL
MSLAEETITDGISTIFVCNQRCATDVSRVLLVIVSHWFALLRCADGRMDLLYNNNQIHELFYLSKVIAGEIFKSVFVTTTSEAAETAHVIYTPFSLTLRELRDVHSHKKTPLQLLNQINQRQAISRNEAK